MSNTMRCCVFILVAIASVVICSTDPIEIRIMPAGDPLNMYEGIDTSVSCEVYVNRQQIHYAQISWVPSGDRKAQNSAVFNISQPTAADSGVYTCNAKIDKVELDKPINIKFHPKSSFLSYSQQQKSVVGKDAHIKINISHPELTTIIWKRNDVEIKNNEHYSLDDHKQTLVIKNYTDDDAGNYTVKLWHNGFPTDPAHISVTTAIMQKPVLPSITCDATQLPTRAVCTLDTAVVDPLRHPTEYVIEYIVLVNNTPNENKTAQGKITDKAIVLTGLRPSSSYRARFMGTNSAGKTTWSAWQNFSTGSARAPEPIEAKNVKYECHSSSCSVDWVAPEDNGAPITHYTLYLSPANATSITEFTSTLQAATLGQPSHTLYELPTNSTFILRFIANNGIGNSTATDVVLKNTGNARNAWALIGIVLGLVLLLLVLICCAVCLITCRRKKVENRNYAVAADHKQADVQLPPTAVTPAVQSILVSTGKINPV